jgi:hypothetical protein
LSKTKLMQKGRLVLTSCLVGTCVAISQGCGQQDPPSQKEARAQASDTKDVATKLAWPMADQVPADVAAYVGWSGARGDEPLRRWVASDPMGASEAQWVLQFLMGRVLSSDTIESKQLKFANKALAILWRRPWAFWYRGKRGSLDRELIVDAGDDAVELRSMLANLNPHVMEWTEFEGEVVRISKRDVGATPRPATFLSSRHGLGITGHGLPKSLDVAIYIDMQQMEPLLLAGGEKIGGSELAKQLGEISGWSQIDRIVHVGGFGSSGWTEVTRTQFNGPRRGAVRWLTGGPVDPSMLRHVPARATHVDAFRFNPPQVLTDLQEAWSGSAQGNAASWAQGIKVFNDLFAMNIETDLVEPFGAQWVAYQHPDVGAGDAVIWIHEPSDAKKFGQTMAQLGHDGDALLDLLRDGGKIDIGIEHRTVGSNEFFSFRWNKKTRVSWVVAHGVWMIAQGHQSLIDALKVRAAGGGWDQTLESEDLRRLAGNHPLSRLTFDNVSDSSGTRAKLKQMRGLGASLGLPPHQALRPSKRRDAEAEPQVRSATWFDQGAMLTVRHAPDPLMPLIHAHYPRNVVSMGWQRMAELLPWLAKVRDRIERSKSID